MTDDNPPLRTHATKKPVAESWEPELAELRLRQALAREMGGRDRVERQHAGGRLTVRERIDRMLDPGTFQEIGSIAGKASYDDRGTITGFIPANCVFGRGLVDGRPVVVAGDDFTLRGGSADAAIKGKPKMSEELATQFRTPIIRLIEGSGGGGSVKTIETTGRANLPGGLAESTSFHLIANQMAQVPVVGLGLGSVAGLGAARLVASHYSVMVKDIAAVFVAGPPVVERLGEPRTKQELGGWQIQLGCGAVDHAVDTEEQAFDAARRFLSYLPSSVYDLPPRVRGWDDTGRRDESLITAIPKVKKQAYHMRRIIETVVDKGSFFEMGKLFGRSIITGLARLDGWPVALMAGDPLFDGGAWTADACSKIIRFVDMAQTFHLPIVHLVDCPGFQVGLRAESNAVIRWGVRALSAINQTTVPWCSIVVRNCYGVGGLGHQPVGHLCLRYAWPSGSWGSLPLEGGIEAAYRAEIAAAPDPQARLEEIEERLNRLRSPFRTAEAFWVDEVIDPRNTRRLLCDFANLAAPLRAVGEARFGMRP
ncbi:MAG: carboxyl transferase domain-containing protein [Acetobacteraceae bacterium]|nr:carboxyl transferase domain-containing protein [Acetobacteraceae bacterium]